MDPVPTDLQMLAGLRAGDRAAQRAPFGRYNGMLQRFCRKRRPGLSREDAEEIAADTLNHVMEEPWRFDPGRGVPLGAYLCHIALNKAIDRQRKERRRPETHLSPLLPAPPDEPPEPGPMQWVAEEVAHLAEQRKPGLHRVLELQARGYTHREAGRMLGRNADAVRQQVCRGRRWIRQVVEEGALGEKAAALLRRALTADAPNGNGNGER